MALTEQEQIEIFSRWWKENGTFLAIGIVVALAAYFGWASWQSYQQTRTEEASVIFQQILDMRNGKSTVSSASVSDLAQQLTKDYSSTYYGQAVRLILAEEAVKNGNLELAEKELMALVQSKPGDTLLFTARMRLGRVLYAEGKYTEALAQLTEPEAAAYKTPFAELRGDVLLAQGQPDLARRAYESALATLAENSQEDKKVIEMKLNNVAAK